MRLALNHIAAPRLALPNFLALARRLGATEVEIRNDLPDVTGSWRAADVRAAAEAAGVTILSINALYPFNVVTDALLSQAARMADYAAACGAKALVLCPLNDGTPVGHSRVVAALEAIAPILRDRGVTGLVEPLGFAASSLRSKREAIAAIEEAAGWDVFALLHDTFHHHLAGETEIYPRRTALVHVSGVTDPAVTVEAMRDAHRGLVDAADRIETVAQMRALRAAGYEGPFSLEPFAREVHDLADPEAALGACMAFLRGAAG